MVKINDVLLQTRHLYEAMYRFDVQAASILNLHVTDLRCVNALEGGPLSAGEIGNRLALSSGSVTALVNRLANSGFVERVSDPSDARRSLVTLTPHFRNKANQVYSNLGNALSLEFGDLNPDEIKSSSAVLGALVAGFDAACE